MNEQELIDMKLHSTINIVGYDITRVVSGWLYRPYSYYQNVKQYEAVVFVPLEIFYTALTETIQDSTQALWEVV